MTQQTTIKKFVWHNTQGWMEQFSTQPMDDIEIVAMSEDEAIIKLDGSDGCHGYNIFRDECLSRSPDAVVEPTDEEIEEYEEM